MKYTNKNNLPQAIVEAIVNDKYSKGDADISVTGLIAPPQQRALMEKHADQLEDDVSNRIWILIGKATHYILENSGSTGIKEQRLYTIRNGWRISGQFDEVTEASGILQDYKVTSAWSVKDGHKPDWEAQLNLYNLLAFESGYLIQGLQIVAILRDWSALDAQKDEAYPKSQVKTINLPMWSVTDAEKYLQSRVDLHQRARKGEDIPCSDEERWKTADKWAVMKKGAKRAIKLCPSEADAGILASEKGEGHYVEFRKGECKRCQAYCAAAPFCSQWKAEQEK
jgi:hypothetical protein